MLTIWIIFAVLTSIAASARGRNWFAWLIIGFATSLAGLIAVLVMRNLHAEQQAQMRHSPNQSPNYNPSIAHPQPTGLHKSEAEVGSTVKVYKGTRIIKEPAGFSVNGTPAKTVIEAERLIDAATSRD